MLLVHGYVATLSLAGQTPGFGLVCLSVMMQPQRRNTFTSCLAANLVVCMTGSTSIVQRTM